MITGSATFAPDRAATDCQQPLPLVADDVAAAGAVTGSAGPTGRRRHRSAATAGVVGAHATVAGAGCAVVAVPAANSGS